MPGQSHNQRPMGVRVNHAHAIQSWRERDMFVILQEMTAAYFVVATAAVVHNPIKKQQQQGHLALIHGDKPKWNIDMFPR